MLILRVVGCELAIFIFFQDPNSAAKRVGSQEELHGYS
jgi:hypothetical protein